MSSSRKLSIVEGAIATVSGKIWDNLGERGRSILIPITNGSY